MKIVIDGLFYHGGRSKSTRRMSIYNRTFPSLNDFLDKAAISSHARNTMKRHYQNIAGALIRQQAIGKIENEVFIFYSFYERDKRRDPSNIASFFIKVFEDALQECGVISNDNWIIQGFACYFYVDRKHPRVEVEIKEKNPTGYIEEPSEGYEEEEDESEID